MKRLKVLTALAMGIMASASGVIQVEAAIYTFPVNFSTKTVANFNDFKQSYYSTTYDLGATITFNFSGVYSFQSCPTPNPTVDVDYRSGWQVNGVAPTFDLADTLLPNMPCSTSLTTYSAERTIPVSDTFVSKVIDDDANFIRFITQVRFNGGTFTNGLNLRLHNYTTFVTLNYNFDTTYLFNYFLSDTQAVALARTGTWNVGSDLITKVDYVYTTAGNDEYRIVNTDIGSIGTLRRKYALDYNQEFFRGNSIGARIRHAFNTEFPYTFDQVTIGASGTTAFVDTRWDYHYLNAANQAQAIVDAPVFDFEYDDCGSFLALNVGCFINNAFAYITNDAPIVSDAFTLLNAGIQMAAQTFGIIGEFADDNVFGVLILAGFGFIAVKWFLKND